MGYSIGYLPPQQNKVNATPLLISELIAELAYFRKIN